MLAVTTFFERSEHSPVLTVLGGVCVNKERLPSVLRNSGRAQRARGLCGNASWRERSVRCATRREGDAPEPQAGLSGRNHPCGAAARPSGMRVDPRNPRFLDWLCGLWGTLRPQSLRVSARRQGTTTSRVDRPHDEQPPGRVRCPAQVAHD